MTQDERRRWLEGRHDWRDQSWEDHCGDPFCDYCNERSYMVEGDRETAELRHRFERSILGAEVERL